MCEGYLSMEELKRHLADAGLDKERIAELLSDMQGGNRSKCLRQLETCRTELLDEIHRERHCIETLDKMLCDIKGQRK